MCNIDIIMMILTIAGVIGVTTVVFAAAYAANLEGELHKKIRGLDE